jgi:hypothetical protein
MYTPKFSTKRLLSLVTAGALAATGTVALATSSEAAAPVFKLGSTTTSVSQAMTVTAPKGVDFTDDGGLSLIDLTKIDFVTTACAASKASVSAILGTAAVAVTPAKITLTSPSVLALTSSKPTKYNVCFYSASTTALSGAAVVTVYAAPAGAGSLTFIPVAGGPSYGGTKITVTGQDFTSATKISVGGVLATGTKVTLGKLSSDPDSIVALTPPGTNATAPVKVVGEWGTSAAATATFAYAGAIKISPNGSDGIAGRVVTVTGSGFNSLSWSSTLLDTKSSIAFVPAGTVLSGFWTTAVATPAGTKVCTGVVVNSDTELTCSIPTMTTTALGAYTAVIVTYNASYVVASSTGYTRGATYTTATY